MKNLEKILENTVEVLPKNELLKKLQTKKELIIKLGADPTAPNLHLGHAVVLEKLKDLQDLGHKIVFLIGDFTAKIGDPSGKSKIRPPLSDEQIKENSKTYFQQISRILDISKTEIVYNSNWISKIKIEEWLKIFANITLARLIERDDFQKRLKENISIGFHEMMYPIMQAYDSVHLNADIEIGGTDQTFNLIIGRHLQEQMNLEPQIVITMPLLVGTDGINKMSKSLKNDIGFLDSPEDVFGKIMSISDDLMCNYFKILLRKNENEISELKKDHPMNSKKKLAYEIVKKYWSEESAKLELISFEKKFQSKNYESVPELFLEKNEYKIINLIALANPNLSRSEIRRLIKSGAISINNSKITDEYFSYLKNKNDILKTGKIKIYKIY